MRGYGKQFEFKKILNGTLVLLLILGDSCKEPYHPTVVAQDHYLVVEGFIKAGNEPTTITLTRTRNLSDIGVIISANGITDTLFERHAQVSVEDDAGNSFVLPELGKGQYGGVVLPVDAKRNYRLHIVTADNREYASAFVPVLPAPVIDSVYWRLEDDGVHIYLDAHHTNDTARYYRWTYTSTWEFYTWYHLMYEYVGGANYVRELTPEEFVDTCWSHDRATSLLISNSLKLSANVLSRGLVEYIPVHSKRLMKLFTIRVTAYAITPGAYAFWQQMEKNTEELGSVFGPQPSAITGNIRCLTYPQEPVIGYVEAGMSSQQRMWINNRQLPASWNTNFYDCGLLTVPGDSIGWYFLNEPRHWAVIAFDDDFTKFQITRRRCADCTERGVRKKPDFWP